MTLRELISKLHTSTRVIIHKDGEDVELTPRIMANCGTRPVLEIGIVGEAEIGEETDRKTGEPEHVWLHVSIGEEMNGILFGSAGNRGCSV